MNFDQIDRLKNGRHRLQIKGGGCSVDLHMYTKIIESVFPADAANLSNRG